MREFSAATWEAIEAKTTALERNQALASQFSAPCTIDFLDGDGEIIRTVSTDAWTAQQVAGGYRAVPGIYTDAAVGEGIPEVAVFRSGGTEVFRVDCSVQIDATYRLAGNIAAGVPIRRGDFGIGVLPRVSGGATAPVVVQAPSIAGEAKVGALLVATPGQYSGNPAPTVTRQWIVGGAVLAGESGPTYTVRAVDVGKSVGYRETASNGIGSAVIANSNYLGPVVAGALQFPGPALIQIEQGGTYSLAQHAAGGTPPYTYSHTGALPSGVTLNPSTGILSATAGATITTSGDIDFHADDSSAAPQEPAEAPPVNVTAPSISGAPQVGQTLTANPGVWTGNPTPTFTRQWLRNGTPISGQTGTSYVLVAADEGASITLRVTASNGVGSPVDATSAPTAPVLPAVTESAPINTSAPYIVGLAEVGGVLAAFPGEWDSTPEAELDCQWVVDGGVVPSQDRGKRTYVIPPEHEGAEIQCRFIANNGVGITIVDSEKTAPIAPEYEQDEFPQYLLEDDGRWGPSRVYWNRELEAVWPAYAESYKQRALNGTSVPWNYDGNWTNKYQVSNSLDDPYDTITGLQLHNLPEYIEFEATDLVERWKTENRGAYIRQSGSAFTFTFSGRLGTRAPEIIITTSEGEQTIGGGYAASFNVSTSSGFDTRVRAQLGGNTRALLHWRDLVVPEGMISAKIRLYGLSYSSSSQQTATLRLYETDIPKMRVGAGSEVPQLGLAAEVGESALPAHPDVFPGRDGYGLAGDFRRENFLNRETSSGLSAGSVSRLSNRGSIEWTVGRRSADFIETNDGSIYFRTKFVHGTGGDSGPSIASFSARWLTGRPVLSDPNYALDPSSVEQDEMYVRAYTYIDHDFWSTTDGIKWGLGFDLRFGFWSGSTWQQTTGNSGSKGTGKRYPAGHPNASNDKIGPQYGTRWEYQGHSIRGHLGYCRASGTRYQRYRPFRTMCSNNGPYVSADGVYGSEETMTSPTTVLEKGKWHCIEWRIKLNTVTGPYDEFGNGVAVPDGILEGWVDGVKAFSRTDLAWRCHPDIGVNSYWIENMHGGTNAPAKGEELHHAFNHFCCARRYIGPKVP